MRKLAYLLAATAAAVTMLPGAASATSFLYTFSDNNGLNGASGSLEATANGNGTFTATSGTITAFGPVASGVGSLIANPSAPGAINSPSGFFSYDSQLLPGQNPLITTPGLLFSIGGAELNIFSNGPGPSTYSFFSNVNGEVFGSFALSEVSGAVPEPATWAMMIAGFGMIGFAARRRQSVKTTVTYA